jgi:hypothetical protein
MATYLEVAQALAEAGYLTEADVEAASTVLADALIVAESEDAEAAAMDDYSVEEDIIAEAEVWESEDAVEGDFSAAEEDEDVIADASAQEELDKETVLASEAIINAAYTDAAAALVAADLIDEANAEAAAAVIANLWVLED